MSNTKAFIDYTMEDNGTSARDALYAEIHDRVMSHIEQKKMELAGGMLAREEKSCEYSDMKEKIAKKEEKVEKLKEELSLLEAEMCDSDDEDEDEDSEYEDKKKKLKKTMKKLKKMKEELALMESGEIDEEGEWEGEIEEFDDEESDEDSEE